MNLFHNILRFCEIIFSQIDLNLCGNKYDVIGKSTNWIANNLNQYTSILRASQMFAHPSGSAHRLAAPSGALRAGSLRSKLLRCISSPRDISHDLDGNMFSDGIMDFTYDAANRLKTVSSNGVLIVTNFYDAKSRRVKKVTQEATATFFYDGWNLIEERIAYTNGTSSAIHYFWGKDLSGTFQGAGGVEGLLAVSMDGVFYIPCYDHNGNIVLYVSEAGSIAAQYVYDPYGNVVETYGNLAEAFSFGFSTKYHDREIGMVGYQRRFYRPDLGRWLNRDPTEEEGGENLYAFCLNSPIYCVDKTGCDIWVENTTAVYGYHQRVCVTVWTRDDKSSHCCNGVGYRRSGSYCISFGIVRTGNEDSTDSYSGDGGSFDSDSSGDSSTSGDEAGNEQGKSPFPDGFDGPNPNGDGMVYPDNRDPATKRAFFLSTGDDPCMDMEILNYMQGLVGQNANYSIFFQNCRSFSQAVFNRINKGKKK